MNHDYSDLVIYTCIYRHVENDFENWQTYMLSQAGHNGKHRSSSEDSVIMDRYLQLESGGFTLNFYWTFKLYTRHIENKFQHKYPTSMYFTLYLLPSHFYTNWSKLWLFRSLSSKDHLSINWNTAACYALMGMQLVDKDAVEKRKGEDNVSVTQTVSSHLLSKSTHVPKEQTCTRDKFLIPFMLNRTKGASLDLECSCTQSFSSHRNPSLR